MQSAQDGPDHLDDPDWQDLEDGDDDKAEEDGGTDADAQCYSLLAQLKARDVADESIGWEEIEMTGTDLSEFDSDPAAAQRLGSNQRPVLDEEVWRQLEDCPADGTNATKPTNDSGPEDKDGGCMFQTCPGVGVMPFQLKMFLSVQNCGRPPFQCHIHCFQPRALGSTWN